MGKRRELNIKVQGQRRQQVDTRRMARAIVRLAVDLDTEHAQQLADQLETEDRTQRSAVRRARAEQREATDKPNRGAA
jgi:hypothetical protein